MAKYALKVRDRDLEVEIEDDPQGGLQVRIDGSWRKATIQRLGSSPRYALSVDGRTFDVVAVVTPEGFNVHVGGVTHRVESVRRARRQRHDRDESGHLEDGRWVMRSPLTGAVIDVRVSAGSAVEPGDVLLVIEAMKMQNELRSRVGGTVSAVHVERGQRVELGALLIEITAKTAPVELPP